MKKVDAKVDYFLPAASPKELAAFLASQWGGNRDEWEREVKTAINGDDHLLIPTVRNGQAGYRTRRRSERDATSVKAPMPVYNNRAMATS